MSHTVDTLEAVFENAECKLNVVLCEIERVFAEYDNLQQKMNDDQDGETLISMNPVKLISDLKELAQDLESVKDERKKLKQREKELSVELENEFATVQNEVKSALKAIKQ